MGENIEKNTEDIRLNKYLSEAGVCSRREADRLIEAGKVLVDGEPARTGQRIRPGQRVQVLSWVERKKSRYFWLYTNLPASSAPQTGGKSAISWIMWDTQAAFTPSDVWTKIRKA